MTGLVRAFSYAWALPTTLLGLAAAGLALLTGGRAALVGHVVEVSGGGITRLLQRGPLARAGIAAMTLGHVVIATDRRELDACRAHERIHVAQCERWGPLFLPAYAAASLWARVRGRDPYLDNAFEREALAGSRLESGAAHGAGAPGGK